MSISGSETAVGTPVLLLDGIEKRFGITRALADASIAIAKGHVHALLGENGAGKTTLMRVAYGIIRPDAGRVLLDGRAARIRSPADAIRSGVGMVHQHFSNIPAMTVAENIALGGRGLYSPEAQSEYVRALGRRTGLLLEPDELVASLSIGAQQRLEILKALAHDARILIMDEPTAVLAPAESEELLRWLREFADRGGAVVLITHKLHEARAIADEITVLRHGRTVLSSPASNVDEEELTRAMLGDAPPAQPRRAPVETSGVAVRVTGVSLRDEVGRTSIVDASLEVRRGEILGVVALENSGHQLLLRAIAGRATPLAGTIERASAVAFIPEDRQRDAVIMSFPLTENVALRGSGAARGRMRWTSWRNTTERLVREFDVRATSIESPVRTLSGGNQQKLVLARELADSPPLVVAENPTRGLDIRATAEVHERLRSAAAQGAGVAVYSSDLDEVLSIATRLVAVHGGRVRDVPNDRELAGRAMLGLA